MEAFAEKDCVEVTGARSPENCLHSLWIILTFYSLPPDQVSVPFIYFSPVTELGYCFIKNP
jgi:hypothetical protein